MTLSYEQNLASIHCRSRIASCNSDLTNNKQNRGKYETPSKAGITVVHYTPQNDTVNGLQLC